MFAFRNSGFLKNFTGMFEGRGDPSFQYCTTSSIVFGILGMNWWIGALCFCFDMAFAIFDRFPYPTRIVRFEEFYRRFLRSFFRWNPKHRTSKWVAATLSEWITWYILLSVIDCSVLFYWTITWYTFTHGVEEKQSFLKWRSHEFMRYLLSAWRHMCWNGRLLGLLHRRRCRLYRLR